MLTSKMFLPNFQLSNWIKAYWFLIGNGIGENKIAKRILQDGCATIFIVIEGSLTLSLFENRSFKRGIYIMPPLDSHEAYISDDFYAIDIHFNPSIFYQLFKIPAIEFSNKIYTAKDLGVQFDETLIDKINDTKHNISKVNNIINSYFLELFNKNKFYADELISNINGLYKDGDLNRFFKEQNLSIRQIERKVKDFTGLTPKNISRIGRFYSVLDFMKFRQFNIDFNELTLKHNFSDQSHFIREFKHFTNDTPNRFVKGSNNFPQFKGLCNLTKII
ncbi:MAG: DUF6597 domain-containing transcriptional factor [Halarcobacter sp.]